MATLREADLRSAKYVGTDFTGADLTDTSLAHADFNGANLTDAGLDGAARHRTNFVGAIGLPEHLSET